MSKNDYSNHCFTQLHLFNNLIHFNIHCQNLSHFNAQISTELLIKNYSIYNNYDKVLLNEVWRFSDSYSIFTECWGQVLHGQCVTLVLKIH